MDYHSVCAYEHFCIEICSRWIYSKDWTRGRDVEERLDQMTTKEVLHEVHCALNRLAIQVTRNGERMITKDEFK